QIVYYLLIVALIMYVGYGVHSVRKNDIKPALKAGALGLLAGIIGLANTALILFPTYDYAKESMRGGRSELTLSDTTVKTRGGLDKDYAFRYSLALPETFTFLVPALYGGGNGSDEFKPDTRFTEQFSALGVSPEQAVQYEN